MKSDATCYNSLLRSSGVVEEYWNLLLWIPFKKIFIQKKVQVARWVKYQRKFQGLWKPKM